MQETGLPPEGSARKRWNAPTPPSELRKRLERAIEERIDWIPWDRAIIAERAELDSIRKIAGTMADLFADAATGGAT